MSNEGYKFQISGDIGNAMWVFRGDSVEEVLQQAQQAAAATDDLYNAFQAIQQVAAVKEAFSAKGFNKGGGAAAPAASGGDKPKGTFNRPAQQSSSGGGKQVVLGPDGSGTCPHGVKKLDYAKADGTRVVGWYCQSKDKDWKQKCRPFTLPGHGEAA